ncbi:hypothetical protein [Scopulibacillus cellulosilyticus]|uniref:Uncharacterized protein n=1 Tax=Scopulibacillus cellulosilyticus TaxID=2665665 RepID=A0ABW2PY47_9BACL
MGILKDLLVATVKAIVSSTIAYIFNMISTKKAKKKTTRKKSAKTGRFSKK